MRPTRPRISCRSGSCRTAGHEPGYEEKHFDAADKRGRLRLVGSPDGADGSVVIHQDVRLFAGLFDGDEAATLALAPGRAPMSTWRVGVSASTARCSRLATLRSWKAWKP
jgi:hypothetical protein